METVAHIKYIKISPKKLRFIADSIRSMRPVDALDSLFYSKRRSAKVLYKAIKSAVDNAASDSKQDRSKLTFKSLIIDEGSVLRRFRAGSRGVAKPYRRRTSHIKVVLEEAASKKEKIKNEKKAISSSAAKPKTKTKKK